MEGKMSSNMNVIEKRMYIRKVIDFLLVEWDNLENLFHTSTSFEILNQLSVGLVENQVEVSEEKEMGKVQISLEEKVEEIDAEVSEIKRFIEERAELFDLKQKEVDDRSSVLELKVKEFIDKFSSISYSNTDFRLKEIEAKEWDMEFSRKFIEERAKELELKQKALDEGFKKLELKEKAVGTDCLNAEDENQIPVEEMIIAERGHHPASKQNAEPPSVCSCKRSSEKKHNLIIEMTGDASPEKKPSNDGDYTETEFFDFDKDREEECFSVNQIWAVDDYRDSMPRLYALIRKVFTPGFKLKVTWLEPDPKEQRNIDWICEDLPISCGSFILGSTVEYSDSSYFSHQMFLEGSHNASYLIFPRKGEIWAMFNNWDFGWCYNPEFCRKYTYVVVEVLSNFQETGIEVCYLAKVKGFVSVFKRTAKEGIVTHLIPSSELLRFSHKIPSSKLYGGKRGVPAEVFELDTFALPADPNKLWEPEEVNIDAQSMNPIGSRGRKSEDFKVDKINHEESNDSVIHDTEPCYVVDFYKSKQFCPLVPYSCKHLCTEFWDFAKDREEQCFSVNQIWAIYDYKDSNPRLYGYIRKVFLPHFKLKVTWLVPDRKEQHFIDSMGEDIPISCGNFIIFRSTEFSDTSYFSHQISVGKGSREASYSIYPRKGEVWAVFNNWDIGWSCEAEKYKDYTLAVVEILSDFHQETGLKVCYLVRVKGFVSVFKRMADETIGTHLIPSSELLRFSHMIPSYKLTGAKNGVPAGAFELDTAALPTDLGRLWQPEEVKTVAQSLKHRVNSTGKKGTAKKPGISQYKSGTVARSLKFRVYSTGKEGTAKHPRVSQYQSGGIKGLKPPKNRKQRALSAQC